MQAKRPLYSTPGCAEGSENSPAQNKTEAWGGREHAQVNTRSPRTELQQQQHSVGKRKVSVNKVSVR